MSRYVTDEPLDPRERFGLYRLCQCTACDGKGKVSEEWTSVGREIQRCFDCRGEGRQMQEVASCESPEAVGVALITLAREGEWLDESGHQCGLGILDRAGEKHKRWLINPWQASPRNVSDAGKLLRSRRSS